MADETPIINTQQTDPAETTANPDQLPRWEMIALAIGDLIALILFAIAGRSSHGVLAQSGFLGVLNTAIPFMLSWLIASANCASIPLTMAHLRMPANAAGMASVVVRVGDLGER